MAEHSLERDKALLRAWRDIASRPGPIVMACVLAEMARMPAPRFYVGEWRCAIVLSRILSGRRCPLGPLKKRMYDELARRARLRLSLDPSLGPLELSRELTCQTAPSFFLTPSTIQSRLLALRKRGTWNVDSRM